VDRSDYDSLRSGTRFEVRVLPQFARFAHVALLPTWSTSRQLEAAINPNRDLGIGFLVTYLALHSGVLAYLHNRKKLVSCGEATVATVTEKKKTPIKNGFSYSLRYQFLPKKQSGGHTKPSLITDSVAIEEAHWNTLDVGDHFTVLYDSNNAKNHLTYRFCSFEAVPNPRV
jgi:hypothetical protein